MPPSAALPEQIAQRLTSWKVIAVAAAALLAAGAAVASTSQRYASAADLRSHIDGSDRRFSAVETRATALESITNYIHDDLHMIREQERENALATGARVVQTPDHGR